MNENPQVATTVCRSSAKVGVSAKKPAEFHQLNGKSSKMMGETAFLLALGDKVRDN